MAVPPVEAFESLVARGVRGTVEGKNVAIGNARLLEDLGVPVEGALASAIGSLEARGRTAVTVVVEAIRN